MLLPTPLQLHQELTAIVVKAAKCPTSWAEHEGPLSLEEFHEVQRLIAGYLLETGRRTNEGNRP